MLLCPISTSNYNTQKMYTSRAFFNSRVRGIERAPICCFASSLPTEARSGYGGSWEHSPVLPHGWQGSRYLSHHLLLGRLAIAEAGTQSQD